MIFFLSLIGNQPNFKFSKVKKTKIDDDKEH
jgi:hypothetical protein